MQINKLASVPIIYDLLQYLFGKVKMDRILLSEIRKLNLTSNSKVLDLGGGTGLNRKLFPKSNGYVCLDLDFNKVKLSSRRNPDDSAVLGDASRIPIEGNSFDLVLLTSVTHHISDQTLPSLLSEVQRVLVRGGNLLLFDPIYSQKNPLGALILKFDLGEYPRTRNDLYSYLADKFQPTFTLDFTMIHSYLVFIGNPKNT